MNKLQKLHDQFEKVSKQIDSVTGNIYVRMDCFLPYANLSSKLEKLEDKQYDIQCKIEKLEGGAK